MKNIEENRVGSRTEQWRALFCFPYACEMLGFRDHAAGAVLGTCKLGPRSLRSDCERPVSGQPHPRPFYGAMIAAAGFINSLPSGQPSSDYETKYSPVALAVS
jgi:hypothetical protein